MYGENWLLDGWDGEVYFNGARDYRLPSFHCAGPVQITILDRPKFSCFEVLAASADAVEVDIASMYLNRALLSGKLLLPSDEARVSGVVEYILSHLKFSTTGRLNSLRLVLEHSDDRTFCSRGTPADLLEWAKPVGLVPSETEDVWYL
jgi:hypothetical protein